jgi:subtilisin family serine protease
MGKMKWVIAAVIVISTLLFSYPLETKTVNGYKVIKGERPVIDLSEVPADAYYPGRLWIKLVPEMEKFITDDQVFTKTKDGILMKTGVSSIDGLNSKFAAEEFRPQLYGFYDISAASKQHREKHKAWGFHLWMEVKLPQNTNIIQAVKEYMELPEVEFAEPVYKDAIFEPVHKETYDPEIHGPMGNSDPKLTVNDTRFAEQWHYHNTGQQSGTVDCDIDLPEAWDIERGNNQIIVAVQDMGLQLNHPDLAGNIWSGIGYDFKNMDATIEAGDHGCHTGGTISAVTNNNTGVSGIAGGTGSGDGVRLMSVQVYGADGSGGGNTNLPYIYSADNGAAISQNSWGYTTVGSYSQLVLDGIDYFNANGGGSVLSGGLTIFAAGNSNASGSWYPGCYSGAMAVAATNNKDIRSYYSNYDTWVEVSAPGGETNSVTARGVLSCISGSTYAFYQGTSMACPHTSGVAALIISLAPGVFTNTEVRNIIKSTTDPIDALNPTYAGKLGTGRVNAYKALLETQNQMSGVLNPKTFSGTAASTTQINLAWTKNDANNGVMVVYGTSSTLGTPNNGTSYSVGNTIPGGGTVMYKSTGTSFNHTGLNANTTYYYKAFSYTTQNEYSSGKTTNATTLMNPIYPSAASMGFENGGSIPNGWAQDAAGLL